MSNEPGSGQGAGDREDGGDPQAPPAYLIPSDEERGVGAQGRRQQPGPADPAGSSRSAEEAAAASGFTLPSAEPDSPVSGAQGRPSRDPEPPSAQYTWGSPDERRGGGPQDSTPWSSPGGDHTTASPPPSQPGPGPGSYAQPGHGGQPGYGPQPGYGQPGYGPQPGYGLQAGAPGSYAQPGGGYPSQPPPGAGGQHPGGAVPPAASGPPAVAGPARHAYPPTGGVAYPPPPAGQPPVSGYGVPGVPQYGVTLPASSPPNNGLAIGGMVAGIGSVLLSLFSWCSFVPAIPALLAAAAGIVMSVLARKQISQAPGQAQGSGMALTGIICGAVGAGLSVLGLVIYVIFVASSSF